MSIGGRAWVAAFGLAIGIGSSPALAQDGEAVPTSAAALEREVAGAFDAGDYRRAIDLLRGRLARRPKDAFATYNLACALAMAGEHDAAAAALMDAVGLGMTDLFHMEGDPHLASIRERAEYRAIITGWRELLDARGRADLDAARGALGGAYTTERDEGLRFSYVSAFRPESFADARREIARVARWAEENLGIAGSSDADRPDPWVLVVLPTPEDFARLTGMSGVGGIYDRDRKRLVARDLGPGLRHECFHALHWREMDRLRQRHPYWIMEGLAALLEDVEDAPGGGYALAPSWRTNIARRLERSHRLTPWRDLFAMERVAFMGSRARANYAQARAVLMFLHERGVLRQWYRGYVEGYAEDASGASAMERVFGRSIGEVEKEYRGWLRGLPMVGEIARPGEAGLGVEIGPGSGDGPEVAGIVAMSRARAVGEERLRRRDVIRAVNGRSVRTLDDLHRVLADYEVGDVVALDIRRGNREVKVEVELVSSERE